MLTRIEKLGGVFRDNGKQRDFLKILKSGGANCFRLRIFVNPNGKNAVINDLPYTLTLAKRIKASGCKLLLDFHYSDTWADPGQRPESMERRRHSHVRLKRKRPAVDQGRKRTEADRQSSFAMINRRCLLHSRYT